MQAEIMKTAGNLAGEITMINKNKDESRDISADAANVALKGATGTDKDLSWEKVSTILIGLVGSWKRHCFDWVFLTPLESLSCIPFSILIHSPPGHRMLDLRKPESTSMHLLI